MIESVRKSFIFMYKLDVSQYVRNLTQSPLTSLSSPLQQEEDLEEVGFFVRVFQMILCLLKIYWQAGFGWNEDYALTNFPIFYNPSYIIYIFI